MCKMKVLSEKVRPEGPLVSLGTFTSIGTIINGSGRPRVTKLFDGNFFICHKIKL